MERMSVVELATGAELFLLCWAFLGTYVACVPSPPAKWACLPRDCSFHQWL